MPKLASNIKWLRVSHNFTQEEFAQQVGVKKNDLANWELGRNRPRPENLRKIVEHFSLTLDDIINKDLATLNPNDNFQADNALIEALRSQIEAQNKAIAAQEETIRVQNGYIDTLKGQIMHVVMELEEERTRKGLEESPGKEPGVGIEKAS